MAKKTTIAAGTLLTAGLLISISLQAQENMSFRGTLIEPPPCTINESGVIDVDFGERVGIRKVDGEHYKLEVPYHIRCEGDAGNWEMTLMLRGSSTSFDSATLQTNKMGLGIRMLLDSRPLELNKPVFVNPKVLPVLEAVPVQRPGVTLVEGGFTATATLQAAYQ
ncbi:fimbrial protein [Pseudomonas chlororaphis]|uniref:fimbrial protein n=1 Tax=Pseudomonas chlororaphis TaxID=587753 RepID=UPI0006A657E3|nr:fimbrial protein [Pseudomonas chlororaphis]